MGAQIIRDDADLVHPNVLHAIRIGLRPADVRDFDFAWRTYRQTVRWIIERLFGWVEADAKADLIAIYRRADVRIITVNGEDAGWLQVRESPAALDLAQLYICPAQQGQGVGTEILSRLSARAERCGKPLTLAVVKFNPALRLYRKAGFRTVRADKHKFHMRWDPPAG